MRVVPRQTCHEKSRLGDISLPPSWLEPGRRLEGIGREKTSFTQAVASSSMPIECYKNNSYRFCDDTAVARYARLKWSTRG